MQPISADVCYQQRHHTPAAGGCSNAPPAGYIQQQHQQQRQCTAGPGATSTGQAQHSPSPCATLPSGFGQQQQQQPLQFSAAGKLLGAVMSTIEQELQREIHQFAGAVVQRHKQQLLQEIQSLSLAAAAAGIDTQALAAAAAPAAADVPSRPSSSMAAAEVASTGCCSSSCNCHRHAKPAPAGYVAAATAVCQQQQQHVPAAHATLPLGSVGSNEAALISFMSAGAGVAAAAAPLSSAQSLSHDSSNLALPCTAGSLHHHQQQQQQQRVSSPGSTAEHCSGITNWTRQYSSLAASPAAAAPAPASLQQQQTSSVGAANQMHQLSAFAAAGGASSSSSPSLCGSVPQQQHQLLHNTEHQQQQQCSAAPAQQQQQQQPCAGHQSSYSGQSMQSSQLLGLPSLQECGPFEQQQQQLVHSPADVSQTGGGPIDAWQQQQQFSSADELFASMEAACGGDSTGPIAENIFEEIDALLGDDFLNDVLDPVMGLEEQPLLLQASLQQVQQQLQQLEQLQHLQQQQQQPAPYAQLQLDVSSATCSGAAGCSGQQQQQQQLTPCSAPLPSAAGAVFAKPRPLHRSFSACSSKSGRAAAVDVAAAGLMRCGSQTPDQNKKRSRGDLAAAAAAAAAAFELPALKRQGSNKSSSSGGTASGDGWCGGWQQQQQQAVGVDLMAQLPPWLTRQVSITASLVSQSQ
uniref:Uncharacterized protein n=1 Tax=Tetradesmus obliquus TaxID=3088 RepID=A0A383W1X1_TETOB